jgi:very-short-patch-repair endonuclease
MTYEMFPRICKAAGLPEPEPEHRFSPPRRWRVDFAWPDRRVALEIEGGAFTRGRHTRGGGFVKDMEKYNAATLAGWRVLRVTPQNLLTDGPDLIARALRGLP